MLAEMMDKEYHAYIGKFASEFSKVYAIADFLVKQLRNKVVIIDACVNGEVPRLL